MAFGLCFTIVVAVYLIALYRLPRWFGSFKNKFLKFSVFEYFYIWSTVERFITAALIVGLSPSGYSAGVVCCVFVAEALLIAIKKPYILETWKRPFANKLCAIAICLFYVVSSYLENSFAKSIVPIFILAIDIAILGFSFYFTFRQYPENYI